MECLKIVHKVQYKDYNAPSFTIEFLPVATLRKSEGQAVLGRQLQTATPWLTERHGYDPTSPTKTFLCPMECLKIVHKVQYKDYNAPSFTIEFLPVATLRRPANN